MSVEQEARSLLAAAIEYPDPKSLRKILDGSSSPLGQVYITEALRAVTAALLRSSASRDEVLEECAKAVRDNMPARLAEAIPFADAAIRNLKQPAQGGEG